MKIQSTNIANNLNHEIINNYYKACMNTLIVLSTCIIIFDVAQNWPNTYTRLIQRNI